jgi:hypothetical protein
VKPLKPVARWLRPLLVANLLVSVSLAMVELGLWWLLGNRTADGLRTADNLSITLSLVSLLLLLTTATVFILWFRRAYRNEAAAGWNLPHRAGWAIGAWLVPVLNLVRPFSMMTFIWRNGAPGRRKNEPLAPGSNALVRTWWASWLLAALLPGPFSRAFDDASIDGLRRAALISAASAAMAAVAAAAALALVTRITDGHDRRLDDPLPPPSPEVEGSAAVSPACAADRGTRT